MFLASVGGCERICPIFRGAEVRFLAKVGLLFFGRLLRLIEQIRTSQKNTGANENQLRMIWETMMTLNPVRALS